LSAQLGRSKTNFRLWQDQKAIAPGKLWESEIKTAVEQAVFFIPIATPRAANSHYCKFEFEAFLSREHALDRADLVFPVLYIGIPALENEAQWRKDPVLSIIGTRQYVDWRPFRHFDVRTTSVREAIERFCDKIVAALREPFVSPEEHRKQQEIEAQQRSEEERRQRETDAERRAEQEQKQRAEAARQAEEEKQRAEAARQAAGRPATASELRA
jgi:flagellar biosynthesis GTPase FlhF